LDSSPDSRAPDDPLDWLFSLELFGIKLGLENIHTLVEALDRPDAAFQSIHIAGTNGKGSVAALVERALRSAGHRTGRYTSPHLVDICERFALDGRPVPRTTLAGVAGLIRGTVKDLQQTGRLPTLPTFFEVTTAAAFQIFRREGVEVAVCEVGLGGRLDATNVLQPAVTVITSIGLDHQQHLGSRIESIAAEKAGIIKPGVPAVLGRMDPPAWTTIANVAHRVGAPIVDAHADVHVDLLEPPSIGVKTPLRLRTPRRDYGRLELALTGLHQVDNAIVAVRTLEACEERDIRVGADAIRDAFAEVTWPGRLELRRLAGGRELLLDAAHNPEGAAALATAIAADPHWIGCPIVLSVMRDKDVAGLLSALAPVAGSFVMTSASHARATPPAELAAIARTVAPGIDVSTETTPSGALAVAFARSPRVVVGGSIFLLGDVMKVLGSS
jgi:dihydrofolate synthase/folylpolyglutamate synthase